MTNIRPINDMVLLTPAEEKEEKTSSGLYIPDTAQEQSNEATVSAIAPDLMVPFSVGDTVLYGRYSGTQISFDGKDYILVSVDDIIARIVEADSIPV